MKKILFSLMALACSMSMNAQVMKIYNGETLVATYKANQATHVVFEEASAAPAITGTAKRAGEIDVIWLQLWENGPKFAEYNVGAASVTDNGGYYCWGASIDKDPNNVIGEDDTATNLWGSNWRMPTSDELLDIIDNCDAIWTDNYKESGVKGTIFTGKGDYATNSVFFPAAGNYYSGSYNAVPGSGGWYWCSDLYYTSLAIALSFTSGSQDATVASCRYGYSVRAVLAE